MRVLPSIAVALLALTPCVAQADIISDEEANCRSQKAGDACTIAGEAGTCQKSTCARNDYSEGVPPKTKQVECMVCKPGAAPAPVAEEDTKPAPDEAKDENVEAKDESGKDAKAKTQDEASSKSGGCTVGGSAPVGLGLLMLGGLVLGRRRTPRS